ncbi:MAG TPA: calcium-binding protein, partial [Paracoccaceae bacterium]|nr:calcium-binding protein [Paracoccaceae bacterium]
GVGNVLDGGLGSDRLECGEGSDTCVFRPGYGDDTIAGFSVEADLIRLIGFGFSAFEELTLLAEDGDTRIELGPGTSVLVLDVARDAFGVDDFLFA